MPETKRPETKTQEWNSSYERGENFLFYPSEQILIFLARHIAKRETVSTIGYRPGFSAGQRALDFGCGIGRHVKMLAEFGFDSFGIDLSERAVTVGRGWLADCGLDEVDQRLQQADGRNMPFEDGFFRFAVSHGVLDSMPFETARDCISELRRVIEPEGYLYIDLISGHDTQFSEWFSGEKIIEAGHEKGTYQSYFDEEKIASLIEGAFEMLECTHLVQQKVGQDKHAARYHLTLKRIG